MTFWDITLYLLEGFWENCFLFIITLVLALPLGLIITFGSMSKFKPLKWLTRTFVWIIRGTPLMLQLFVVFYVPGLLFNTPMTDRMMAACIAFVINYAAYFSEIYRGGIEGIPKGQYEAGQVLGMTKSQVFFKVVLAQVIKRIMPPISNEVITLVKDRSCNLYFVAIVFNVPSLANSLMASLTFSAASEPFLKATPYSSGANDIESTATKSA
ncbi:MAG: amino acid ABC transporter permease [Ruminococcaceae bacterium]|nr:amino acid ABC transporter permease [Oscillospiraceae bacterium]